MLVRVLGIEGNRIKLSRKALLREQRQKLGLPEPGAAGDIQGSASPAPRSHAPIERQPSSNASTITIEGGDDFDEEGGDEFEGEDEPNFNRIDGTPVPVGAGAGGPGAGGGGQRRRRRRSGGRGRGPGGPGGGNRGPR